MSRLAIWLRLSLLLILASIGGAAAAQPAGISVHEIFRQFLAGHLAAFADEAFDATFTMARYDLSNDGQPEVLVYLSHPIWCGPHSCDLLIFTPEGAGSWRRVAEISVAARPVLALERRTRGWNDLSVSVRDSLMPGRQMSLHFDGQTYSGSPRPLRRADEGRLLLSIHDNGSPIFQAPPSRPR